MQISERPIWYICMMLILVLYYGGLVNAETNVLAETAKRSTSAGSLLAKSSRQPEAKSDAEVSGTGAAVSVNNDEEDEDDPFRTKRQHESHGGFNPISSIIGSIFNKKLGLIGSLSSISSSSKGSGTADPHHGYEYSSHAPAKPFDWWSFKKTILASLLQAVKAITGGVIALNGQLVKVKGHLLAAKGHLLSTKGDSITSFGKHLATHAFGPLPSAHAGGDIHESLPSAPGSAPTGYSAGTGAGFAITGPSNFHDASLVPAYSHGGGGFGGEYTAAVEHSAPASNYYKKSNRYAKSSLLH